MENNKNNTSQKDKKTQDVAAFNDQVGENASEEFRAEEYDNVLENKKQNKGMK